MSHVVLKPFLDVAKNRVFQPDDEYAHRDPARITDLEEAGLIEKKEIVSAPSNKDGAILRRTKQK